MVPRKSDAFAAIPLLSGLPATDHTIPCCCTVSHHCIARQLPHVALPLDSLCCYQGVVVQVEQQ